LLPLSHRPSPKMHWVGSTTIPRSTTSERAELTRLQSVVDLQASEFACHPDRSHRWPPMWVPGRPWRLHPSRTRFVTSPRIGYASRPNRAIDGRGLPPPRSAASLAAPHSFPVRIAQRRTSGYSITFTVPNALQRRSKLTLNRHCIGALVAARKCGDPRRLPTRNDRPCRCFYLIGRLGETLRSAYPGYPRWRDPVHGSEGPLD